MNRLAWLSLALGLVMGFSSHTRAEDPLKVLFLGDKGHHQPAIRSEQLIPVLASRDIDVTYTEDVNALDPKTLADYDALLIYANIDTITPAQEKALLDYVAGGGGFVPVHCASYCFHNSDAYIELVGAQFQRHGTGDFDTKVVDADHPIMKGLEPFHTWDETYVHTKLNSDRHDLQVRVEGDRDEPWTWVRTHGKGRVFYTAYGHDERTWGNPGFHDLIERGIRWAANKGDVFDSRPRVANGLKPFDYVDAPAPIPNYLAGQRWGSQGEPMRTMPNPLEPGESSKHIALPRGFHVELFATEPEVIKPITMNWDHRGRLWVVESIDYPNAKNDDNKGNDRIKICEDTDGDGKADKFTIFAEGLNIPTSLTFANGGVILHMAPETLFLKDNDGDDRADERKVLLRGWGTGDTHAGPSNLHYGFDNWIYGIVGYSAFRGRVGDESLRFGQGLYRFRPDGSKLEFLRSTNNNSWGVGFSEDGLLFGSTANGCPSVYMPIANRYYESVRGWAPSVLQNIADTNRFWPVTDKVRQVDWHGGFTAAAGHALYTARTYPKLYWNDTAFVAEPTGHLVATFSLHRRGSDVASHNAWNLLASNDEWTSPILAEVGPDGNVWVIDWYSYIVQHNPTPRGFETGKGAAYVTPLRDKTHGRIYRVVYDRETPSKSMSLDPEDAKGLIAALSNDNLFWRMHAQRLLVERGKTDVVPELVRLVNKPDVDAIGLAPAAIHALWTMQGLGVLDGQNKDATAAAIAALRQPSAGLRRNAVLTLPRNQEAAEAILAAGLLNDPDAQVRLETLLALSEMPASTKVAESLVKALQSDLAEHDRWMPDAATAAAAANDTPFLRALLMANAKEAPSANVLAIAGRVAEHLGRGGSPEAPAELLGALAQAEPALAETVVTGLARGWPEEGTAKLKEDDVKMLATLLGRLPLAGKSQLILLAHRWGAKGLDKHIGEIAETFLTTARDENRSDAERSAAARQLIEFRKDDAEAVGSLLELISPRTPPELATGLIEAVRQSEAPEAGSAIIEAFGSMTPVARQTAIRTLLSRADWTRSLMDAIDAGQVRLTDLALDQRQALAAHPDRAIAERAKELLAKGGGLPDADRQKVIDELAPRVLNGGDAGRGKLVFQEQCAKCHRHSGEGNQIGPDLTGMAAHPKEELLIHILDPSRSVEGNYVQYSVAVEDGRVLNGLLASESKTAIELLDAENQRHTILREEIDELLASNKSLMPEGFEKQVSPEQIADLLAFLTLPGKYLPLDLATVATVNTTRGMFYSEDADAERLIFPDWSPKTFDGVPFALVDPQGGRVLNAVMLHGPIGSLPPKMPRSVTLPCHINARAIHFLSGVSGWGYPASPEGTVSMIVRLHYADGTTEDHPLKNGEFFADYIREVDVPASKLAFRLRGQQLRYFAVQPEKNDPIESIELIKGRDQTAPIVMAVTVETGG